jgi:DNA-binding NarL/FixJ family response regulator
MRQDSQYLKIKIVLVEDHSDFRESMSYLLNSNEQFECIPYGKAEEALPEIKNDLPDVIIMDINLPGISGIECTRIIKEKYPSIQIMMCTVYEDDLKIFDALKAGASGYILKERPLMRSSIQSLISITGDLQ